MCAAALSTDPAQTGRTLTTSRLSSLYFSQHLICLTLINLVPTSKTHLSSRCPHGPCTTSPSTPVVRVGRPSSAPFVQRKCRLGGEMPHPSSHDSQVRPLPPLLPAKDSCTRAGFCMPTPLSENSARHWPLGPQCPRSVGRLLFTSMLLTTQPSVFFSNNISTPEGKPEHLT